MAVLLPPALPPQEAPIAVIQQAGASAIIGRFKGYELRALALPPLNTARIERALSEAQTLSDAVRNLGRAYNAGGYPGLQLQYALDGQTLWLSGSPVTVDEVRGDAQLSAYYRGIEDHELTDAELERRSALASLHADRAGQNVQPRLTRENERWVLDLQPDRSGPRTYGASAEYSNSGGRFSGRELLDLDARFSLASGDEFNGGWTHALKGVDDDEPSGADHYDLYKLGYSRVTPVGVFGLKGARFDYDERRTFLGIPVGRREARIDQTSVDWRYPIHATHLSRWTVQGIAGYTNREVNRELDGGRLQDQEYGWLEANTAYSRAVGSSELRASLALRQGLGDERVDVQRTQADLGYTLLRPALSAKTKLGKRGVALLGVEGQHSSDTLPDEEQWVLGGVDNLSAYLPGVIYGDSGALAHFDLSYDGGARKGFKLQPRLFVEYGLAQNAANIANRGTATQALADAGAELALSFGSHLRASVTAARSFYDHNVDESLREAAEAKVYFSLRARF